MSWSSSYSINGGLLASMRKTAGDYMPEYGNWRYRVPPPEPPPPPPREDPEVGEEIIETGEYTPEEVVEPTTGNSFADACRNADGSRKPEGSTGVAEWIDENGKPQKKEYLCSWDDSGDFVSTGAHDYKTPGGTKTTPASDTRNGKRYTFQVKDGVEVAGTRKEDTSYVYSPLDKRGSPMKSTVAPPEGTVAPPEDFQDPYEGVDEKLATAHADVETNGSISTKEMHEHVKLMAKDIKAIGNYDADDAEAQQKADTALTQVSTSFTNDQGPEGAINNAYQVYDTFNSFSKAATKEVKHIFSELFQMRNVKPMVDEI